MLTNKKEHPQKKEEQPPTTAQPKVFYGREEEVELDEDWEEKFRKHMEETRRLERESEELKERKEKKENSWQLLKECTKYLKENEPKWKTEEEKNCKEAKNTRLRRAAQQKKETVQKLQQKKQQQKITETWKLLPASERKRLEKEEMKSRKLELRDAKINIWKRWRGKNGKERPERRTKEQQDKDWLDKIEQRLEEIKADEEKRRLVEKRNREIRELTQRT